MAPTSWYGTRLCGVEYQHNRILLGHAGESQADMLTLEDLGNASALAKEGRSTILNSPLALLVSRPAPDQWLPGKTLAPPEKIDRKIGGKTVQPSRKVLMIAQPIPSLENTYCFNYLKLSQGSTYLTSTKLVAA